MAHLSLKLRYMLRKQIAESLSLKEDKTVSVEQASVAEDIMSSAVDLLQAIQKFNEKAPDSAQTSVTDSLKKTVEGLKAMIENPMAFAPAPPPPPKVTKVTLKSDSKNVKKPESQKDDLLKT